MSSGQVQNSSSSGSSSGNSDPQEIVNERNLKRKLSNRDSARRSRMRKQQQLDELLKQTAQLKNENEKLSMQINVITAHYSEVLSGNLILETQLVELTDRLKSVNSVLRFVEEFSGVEIDIPELPDPLLKPWKLPCPTQAILASPSMLQP